jgi:hypothetical protein
VAPGEIVADSPDSAMLKLAEAEIILGGVAIIEETDGKAESGNTSPVGVAKLESCGALAPGLDAACGFGPFDAFERADGLAVSMNCTAQASGAVSVIVYSQVFGSEMSVILYSVPDAQTIVSLNDLRLVPHKVPSVYN